MLITDTIKLSQPLLCYDVAFKAIFTNEENLLAKMVSDIAGIDYELLKDNVILKTNELPISTKNEKAKRCDFILKIGKNHIINLELNASKYDGLIIKNLSYLCNLFTTSTKRSKEYNENLLAMQINLNCYEDNIDKELSQYQLQEVTTHKIYTKNISIFDLNIVKCHQVYYNLSDKYDVPKFIRWGALLYTRNFDEIPDIVQGIMTDKERDRIMDKINKLTHDDLFMTELEALEWAEWERRSRETEARKKGIQEGIEQGFQDGIEQGFQDGIEQGIQNGTKETIKDMILSMIKKEMSLEDISDITGKTIDEINKIVKEQ